MKIFHRAENFSQKGSLMIEVVIVFSIISISVLSALAVAQKALYLTRQSLNQSQVAFLLEEGAEVVRIMRDTSWTNISNLTLSTEYYPSFSGGTWTLSTTPSQVDMFTRTITVSSAYRDGSQNLALSGTADDQVRLVTVTVSWLEGTNTLSKEIQFYIADIFS